MQPKLIIDALKEGIPSIENRVCGVIDPALLSSTHENVALPWIYVNIAPDSINVRGSIQSYDEDVTETYRIILTLDNTEQKDDTLGYTAQEAIEAYRVLLISLLHNRDLDGNGELYYSGNGLYDHNRAKVWWSFNFSRMINIGQCDGWTIDKDPDNPDVNMADLLKIIATYNIKDFDPLLNPVAVDEINLEQ